MKTISNKVFPNERDLYGVDGLHLIDCQFDGIEDGESALKEAKNVTLENCYMNLRYPLWHDENIILKNVEMTDKCRAALWYTNHIKIDDSKLLGIKALRECNNIIINNTKITSPEFGWKSNNIDIYKSDLESEYLFFLASNISLKEITFKGKYSFQYVSDVTIENSYLDTKDAFWHSKNVTVKSSVVKGEYLGWYAENLTFINCKIIGTQPLCYCKNLTLIDCEMEATDFSFEYSDVNAQIKGDILSIKNPTSGKIVADSIGEEIYTEDSRFPLNCEVVVKSK